MKKTHLIILFLLLGSGAINHASAQRHLAGLAGLEMQGGVVNNLSLQGKDNGGYHISIGYSKYYSSKSYWKASFDWDEKRYLVQEKEAFTQRALGGLSYYRTLMKDRGGKFYVNVSFGGLVGYENVNGSTVLLEPGLELKAKSKIMYGLSAGIESEWYVQDRLAIIAQFRQRWLIPSDVANFRWYLGAGVKWIITP